VDVKYCGSAAVLHSGVFRTDFVISQIYRCLFFLILIDDTVCLQSCDIVGGLERHLASAKVSLETLITAILC